VTAIERPPLSVSAAGVGERALAYEPPVVRRDLRGEVGFWFVLAGIVLSCIAGHWGDLHIPVPLDRGLLVVGLVLEWQRAWALRTLPAVTTTAVLLVAATAWAAVSFVGSPVRDSVGLFLLADLYIVPAVLFISAPLLFGTAHRRFVFAAVFTVFGIYLGFTAITQTLHLAPLVFPSYILDPSVGIHGDRARGPYVEAVNDGIMLVFSGVLGAFVASVSTSARWRAAGVFAALLCGIGCALTLTRAIWFAGIAVLLIGFITVPGLRRRLPLVVVGIVVLAVAFLAAFPDFLTAATERGGSQNPIWDRLNVNAGAARMAWAHPLFGVGWQQAGPQMVDFVRLGKSYPVTAASAGLIPHNVFLGRFAELGIPGASLWLAGVVAVLIVPVVRRCRPGFDAWRVVLLAFTVCWLIVANFGPVNYSEPAYLLYLVGGIVTAGRAVVPVPYDWRPRSRQPHGMHRG
jgi:putative inorganic carbon (HCO3(-)) transporter